ncbi:hypothetical protein Q1695_011825 [Nippostrongylus brasiliensis]|nr:hypothetical protein Q1695_011825 [Nippostrongylus brasiliensis]
MDPDEPDARETQWMRCNKCRNWVHAACGHAIKGLGEDDDVDQLLFDSDIPLYSASSILLPHAAFSAPGRVIAADSSACFVSTLYRREVGKLREKAQWMERKRANNRRMEKERGRIEWLNTLNPPADVMASWGKRSDKTRRVRRSLKMGCCDFTGESML